MIVATLGLGVGALIVAKLVNSDDVDDRFSSESVMLGLPVQPQSTTSNSDNETVATTPILSNQQQPQSKQQKPSPNWREITTQVQRGDNLALIFKRNGLSPQDVYLVSKSDPLGTRLKNIYPGHTLQLQVNDTGRLMALTYSTGPLDTLEYVRQGDEFISQQISVEPQRVIAYVHGIIDHSLFVSSQRAGLSDALTMRLAQIFQWDVDFVLDIRPGDQFYVLFEELYLEEELVGFGDILAAEFVNQGDHYRAIQYTKSSGDNDYYAPNGDSMRKAFLRAPLKFSRISSNFNLRRVHPLFKKVRPHRGIDYSAPTDTPILSAGDGKVTRASKTKPNGNYVVIQHGEQFQTKYLHLSKFARGVKGRSQSEPGTDYWLRRRNGMGNRTTPALRIFGQWRAHEPPHSITT